MKYHIFGPVVEIGAFGGFFFKASSVRPHFVLKNNGWGHLNLSIPFTCFDYLTTVMH